MAPRGSKVSATTAKSGGSATSKNKKDKSASSKKSSASTKKPIVYDPIDVNVTTVETTVALLVTAEQKLLEQVLASLNAFVVKEPAHLLLAKQLDVSTHLLAILTAVPFSSSECARRYCLKILAELCEFPEVVDQIRKSETAIPIFCRLLCGNENDRVVYEFASEILSAVAGGHTTVRLLETSLVDSLLPLVGTPDPDVQKNCLELIVHVLRDPTGGDRLCRSPSFALCPLMKLFTSEYVDVQRLVLSVFAYLTRHDDPKFREAFLRERALDALMGVLEQIEWSDLHHFGIQCLRNYCDHPNNLVSFFESGALARLVRFTGVIGKTDIVECALEVLARVAELPGGVDVCVRTDVPQLLMQYLRQDEVKAAETACIGIANLLKDEQVFKMAVEGTVIADLLRFVGDSKKAWETRNFAGLTLLGMMKRERMVVDHVLDCGGMTVFQEIVTNMSSPYPPLEMATTVIHSLQEISSFADLRSLTTSPNLIDVIVSLLGGPMSNYYRLAIDTLHYLSTLLNEPPVRGWFLVSGGAPVLAHLLRELFVPVRLEAVALVAQVAVDEVAASAFIREGVIELLIGDTYMRKRYPVWEAAIENLLNANLSAKFAILRRLELTDITKDNFYMTERVEDQFTVLEDLLLARSIPVGTIYVSSFQTSPQPPPKRTVRRRRPLRPPRKPTSTEAPPASPPPRRPKRPSKPDVPRASKSRLRTASGASAAASGAASRRNSSTSSLGKGAASRSREPSVRSSGRLDGRKDRRSKRMLKRLASKLAKTGQTSLMDVDEKVFSSDQLTLTIEEKYGHYPPDYNLYLYLKNLRDRMREPIAQLWYQSRRIEVPDLIARAQTIAVFVASAMCGADRNHGGAGEKEELRHRHELHLQELKRQSGSSIIPIGHVRVGLHQERAMLFKVLADRVGLPCALQRGQYGRTWVEIAVPEGIPKPVPEGVPGGVTEGVPEGAFKSGPEGVSEGNLAVVTKGVSKRSLVGGSKRTLAAVTEEDPKGPSKGNLPGVTRGKPEGASKGSLEGASRGDLEAASQGNTTGVTEGDHAKVPEGGDEWELPIRLLRPNHVVDLMEEVGDIMPIGGHRAQEYCDLPGFEDYPQGYQFGFD